MEDPLLGTRLGRYEIRERRGSGGMASVYRAHDPMLDRPVALKLLPSHLTADEGARERFLIEARAASTLDHLNVGIVHEIGSVATDPGRPPSLFIAMAYYEGETLAEKLESGPLSVREVVDIGRQVASGLSVAHARGIVHRDIKPANLILTPEGVVKIVDFGVARLLEETGVTRTGTVVGTVAYMSPEQAAGDEIDGRSDIWSAGVVLYEALAGVRPFTAPNQLALMGAIMDADPEPLDDSRPDAPSGLLEVVSRCLEKNPHRRFQTAGALEAALSAVRAGARGRSGKGAAPRRAPARLVGGLAALLALAGIAYFLPRGEASAPDLSEGPPTLAILPPVPVGGDTSLARLADELVVTVSANLTGLGDLRIVDAISILAHTEEGEAYGRERGASLASGLGATAFVVGTLQRGAQDVRLDLQVYRTADGALLDRVTLTGREGTRAALSDSATVAILHAVWEEGDPPAPNPAAISTSSVSALRAYLEGERAFARGDYEAAIAAFERAFAADTTFWFAYWRSVYPRSHVRERPVDREVMRQVVGHRSELPPQDRLLVESAMASTLTERIGRLEALVGAYPHYWPGWWTYANTLVHFGPYVGYGVGDARSALERVLELNPRFVAAWDHLSWMAESVGDLPGAERAVGHVLDLQKDIEAEAVWHGVLRIRIEALRSELADPDTLTRIVTWLESHQELLPGLVAGPVASGLPRAQLRLNAALLARGHTTELAAEIHRGNALAWIARGGWDSAVVAADRFAELADASGRPGAYGLVVMGALVGGLAPEEARRRRPTDPRPDEALAARQSAELRWLDGVLAYLGSDPDALSQSIRDLEASEASRAGILRRSLAAMSSDGAGERAEAARELLDLEREIADGYGNGALMLRHPLVTSANRILAARWLRDLGEDARASDLLTWYDAVPSGSGPLSMAYQVALGAITLVDRAEIAEGLGSTDEARRLYARFRGMYDSPVPPLLPLVQRAQAGLERLGPS